MHRRNLIAVLAVSLLLLLMAGLLFSGYAISHKSWPWLGMISREIQAACRYPGTQWMVVVCLLSYLVTFLILERRILPQKITKIAKEETAPLASGFRLPTSISAFLALFRGHICNPNLWLVGFVVLVLLRYATDYANAAKSLQVVVLLTGMVIGKGVALWAGWGSIRGRHLTSNSQRPTPNATTTPPSILNLPSSSRPHTILSVLTLLLAVAALWQPEMGMEFHYRGVRRWEGVWDNPNTYGLLMGVGTILAIGLIVRGSRFQVLSERKGFMPLATRHLPRFALLVAAGLCGFGLLKSYSRGAWLGTVCGLTWLIGSWVWRLGSGGSGAHGMSRPIFLLSCASWLRRNWLLTSVLLASILILCFWQFRHTESPLMRRVFSAGNVNDFSWRNRVSAWQGAGRMLWDKPLAGFGWSNAEEAYRKDYRAARLEETAAIQLNDYLMLGISAGVPALICLLVHFALNLKGHQFRHLTPALSPFEAERERETSTPNSQHSTAAAAGALVLLIGFWFDGGLFKLPTCVVFWVLLELARCSSRGNETQFKPDTTAELSVNDSGGLTAKYPKPAKAEIALRWLVGIAAVLAIGQTALHFGLPQFAVNERTLSIARNRLVPAREKADFEILSAKPIWSERPLKVLLQHAHLANYNRELVNWKLDVSIYQQYVLSPEIDPVFDGAMNWRRPLWEYFYPRIRKETSLTGAAETVLRHLRERVKIAPVEDSPKTIAEMWQYERADDRGLEAICAAALRAVGIPARLSALGQAEFWNGEDWNLASINPIP